MESIATIVLDVPDSRLLDRLPEAIYDQTHRDVDVLILSPERRRDRLGNGKEAPSRNLHVAPSLDVAVRLNLAARLASGPHLVTLDTGVQLWERSWLRSLLASFRDERVAAVGGADFVPARLSVRCPQQVMTLKEAAREPEYGLNRANAAFRRDILLARPLPDSARFHPERVWSFGRMLEGFRILMSYRARVEPGPAVHQARRQSGWWSLYAAPWLDAIVLREHFSRQRPSFPSGLARSALPGVLREG
ncbi:MAG: glycosyltransferase family 2 protein [Candidatus Sericytochromatia bacterium]|nr:glycosyltransferase family 2 protein [Candidatus Tanganyikabacteria bacterium]